MLMHGKPAGNTSPIHDVPFLMVPTTGWHCPLSLAGLRRGLSSGYEGGLL